MRRDKKKIAEHYGLNAQMQQLIEEMAELTQAICKVKRCNGEGQPLTEMTDVGDNFSEELADVKLVLDQVIYLSGTKDKVKWWMDRKIQRTLERIVRES